jgi:hypothetical protein
MESGFTLIGKNNFFAGNPTIFHQRQVKMFIGGDIFFDDDLIVDHPRHDHHPDWNLAGASIFIDDDDGIVLVFIIQD